MWVRNALSLVLLLCLMCPFAAMTQTNGVRTRLTSSPLVEVTPGKIVTASIVVANLTSRDEEIVDRLTLPAGWHRISPPDLPFTVKAGHEVVRIIAFNVPATAPADRVEIDYSTASRRDQELEDSNRFTVSILPVAKLELVAGPRPGTTIAGEPYETSFRAVNRGNSPLDLSFTTTSSPDFARTLEPERLVLEAGSSRDVRVVVQTDRTLQRKETHVLSLKATGGQSADGTTISASRSVSVEVVPAVTGELDPYVRLPVQLRLISTADKEGGAGFQAELTGVGALDEEGRRQIDFLFRGPDLQNESIYGLRDEYRVSYYDPLFDLHVGDRSYSLSPLTRRHGYGRGVEANIHPGPTKAGAFHAESRGWRDGSRESGAYLSHEFGSVVNLKGNYLHKSGHYSSMTNAVSANIYSIEPRLTWGEYLTLDLEYGVSDSALGTGANADAYRAVVRGELFDRVTYSIERIHADPDFLGYYNDSASTYAVATWPLLNKLRGRYSFNQFERNLERNPARGSFATRETIHRPGLLHSFASGTDVSVEYQNIRREDVLLPAAFDFQEHSVRLGVGHGFDRVSLQAFVEQGALDNRLLDRTEHIQRYSAHAYYRPTPRQTYSIFTTIGSERYTAEKAWMHTYGASASWRLRENFSVSTHISRNSIASSSGFEQDNAQATVSYRFENEHSIAVSGRWSHNHDTRETALSGFLSYTIPFGVPVGKKRSVGMLKGRVLDMESNPPRPLPRVILRINGTTAVTDRNGEFVFPSLAPGSHRVSVDQGTIGLEHVTTEPAPYRVEISRGKTTTLNIGVTRSSRASVRLVLCAAANRNLTSDSRPSDADRFEEIGGLEGGLVELNNGREMLRQVTDRDGRTSFANLRPGRWNLTVYENGLPHHHYLEVAEQELEMSPATETNIQVRVLPKHRPIRFIDEGVIRQDSASQQQR